MKHKSTIFCFFYDPSLNVFHRILSCFTGPYWKLSDGSTCTDAFQNFILEIFSCPSHPLRKHNIVFLNEKDLQTYNLGVSCHYNGGAASVSDICF